MDDYYELLGVDADASVDDIKAAYRERKESIASANGGGSKSEAASLNKAWNVLSDPYQRGRYDQQRADALEAGEPDGDGDDIDVETRPARSGRSGAAGTRQTRDRRQLPPPTIKPPAGTAYPAQKQRIIAMAIDLVVLAALLLVAISLVGPALARSQKPDVVKAIDAYNKQITDTTNKKDAAQKQVDAAKTANNTADQTKYQKQVDAYNAQINDLTKKRDHESSKVNGYVLGSVIGAFVLGFLYLAIPSGLTGATVGKRFQHLRVVRQDGSPLGWKGTIVRYGMLMLVTLLLTFVLGYFAPVIVLFGVTMWMRNPNQQGIHDRFAHTIVVTDAPR